MSPVWCIIGTWIALYNDRDFQNNTLSLEFDCMALVLMKQNSWKPLQYNQWMMVYHKSYMPPLAYNLFQLFQLHMIECLHMHQSLIQLGIFAWQHRSKLMGYKVEQEFEQIPKTKVTWKWTFVQNCHFLHLKICFKPTGFISFSNKTLDILRLQLQQEIRWKL